MQNVNSFVVYEVATGIIRRKIQCRPDEIVLNVGEGMIEGDVDLDQYYVDPTQPALVPRMQFAEGVLADGYFTIALPVGTTVLWQSEIYTVDDGELDVLVDQPGVFSLHLSHPHYVHKVVNIENP
ncbi:hypothetical protein [Bowmanella sp. JS7-9]|uniref:Uncharacterized protein n=1 Tax=Pseudobowmanella zhangzhouensis TaxID=1537679 RepID=A0ABW1XQK9_9ALTE|nr:hypothetical protein [Bowmanella sp. JS7-9]TBX21933.1 hypothetical protein TK45_10625 [Bowmanella sp. JS7-9]